MSSLDIARPDPDALLRQIQDAEGEAKRGKLRIYFGASAGVGKTFAMLSAAQRALQDGQQVLVGLVETHGRRETQALVEGLHHLPLKAVPYRGQVLQEFDLDAALAAHPNILLVDELAHSNAPGCRHPKRWQDVVELLDAGIDVWTALNVQHLESLNGTVGSITGVRVNETVPDTVMEQADEIILVDVPADELLQRLKDGKVYVAKQAERATQNFFRKGNLIALREIALRRTAEHVGDDVRTYRSQQILKNRKHASAQSQSWNTSGTILVCVGPHEGAEHAVRSTARMAGQLNVRWHAAYVETPALQRRKSADRDRTLSVLKLAEELGANTAVLSGDNVASELLSHAQTLNCATLVVGRPKDRLRHMALRAFRPTLTRQLANLAPTLDILEVGAAQSVRRLPMAIQREYSEESLLDDSLASWRHYAWAIAACLLTTLLAFPLANRIDLANIVMLFLLAVVGVALRFGRGPAMLAALVSVASFDFFFVPPRYSFAVSDVQYLMTFGVMLAVGLLIGQLTANLRFAVSVSNSRERRAKALFDLSRELSAALHSDQVVALGEAAVKGTFGGQSHIVMMGINDALQFAQELPAGFDSSVADWAFHNGQSAGLATSTLPSSQWHYVPLKAPMRVRGVLALCPAHSRWLLIPEQVQQLETLARQIAIGLERVHYVEIAQSAVVQMESERLRNTLLAAMSHDVRTPLTSLVGMAESLAASTTLTAQEHHAAQAICNEARDLSALVTNLLEMARLESGTVELRREWQSVEEVIGSAIRAARHALGTLVVRTHLPPDLPLVEFDAAMMERVLVNLIENAVKYGLASVPTPVAVDITAMARPDSLVLRVRDYGPGLPQAVKGREKDLFEKFTRGQSESSTRGVGLGLAICKAIVEAHHGTIAAAPAHGGGAEFSVVLPRTAPPVLPMDVG